ncbi:MAG: hypothetical protein K0R17_3979, partial [Rariglobus sp.]|nr:hypothetical protein [Rariglobus sp.]
MPTPHSDFPNVRRSPDAARHHGFALLVTITLLSFLVLLLVSLAALTRVETQVANNSQLLAQARQNALFGLQIALGELQRHAGPDQRISVPATTVYPAKNVTSASGKLFDLYRNRADTTSGARKTFLTTASRPLWESDLRAWWAEENRNPHWTGIYDSGLRRDAAVPSARYGEPRRDQLPRWLVSGNERPAMNFDAATATTYPTGYLTPDKDLATQPGVDPADIVELVGAGSSSSKDDSIDGLSGTVRVVRQPLAGTPPGTTAPQTIGHYAYWVGDESQKANFAVRDPWFDENDPDTLEYRNRLLVPQRIGWERINGFREVFDSGTGLSVNDDRFLKILAREQIPLLDPNFREPVKNAFHHLTAYSRSLHTDTALGGLKKDLTVFLQGTGSGLPLSEPIASPSLYANSDPRLGGGTGFPSSVANVATFGDLKHWADTDVPNEAASVSVEPGRAPVVVNFQILFAFTRSGSPSRLRMHFIPCVVLWNPFDTALAETTYDLGWRHNVALFQIGVATKGLTDPSADNADGMIMPAPHSDYFVHPLTRINDWFFATDKFFTNLSRPLLYIPPSSTTTTPNLYLAPFDRRDTAAPSSYGDRYLPTLPNGDRNPKVTWVPYRFTTGFKAGQVKVFTIANSQFVSDVANLHSGNTVIQLKNGFDPDFPKSFYFDIADLGNP